MPFLRAFVRIICSSQVQWERAGTFLFSTSLRVDQPVCPNNRPRPQHVTGESVFLIKYPCSALFSLIILTDAQTLRCEAGSFNRIDFSLVDPLYSDIPFADFIFKTINVELGDNFINKST